MNVLRRVLVWSGVENTTYFIAGLEEPESPILYDGLPLMQFFNLPEDLIRDVAAQIHSRTNRDYRIPVVGTPGNLETPQVFEIMPFDQIDTADRRFYAIDGSRNSHTFYNGISICFYQAGYVCFQHGQQVRLNDGDDPVILGQVYHGQKLLVLSERDLADVYDDFLALAPVTALLSFFGSQPEEVFPYSKETITQSIPALLGFCQEVLEWACLYDIATHATLSAGDFVLRDGALRSLHIKQRYLVKLGYLFHTKNVHVVAITKQSPIKTELSYTYSKIDSYLQAKLRPEYPFKAKDPKAQKLCCYFEARDDLLEAAYQGSGSGMYAKKDIMGGRGFGLFFTARLDYVEKLQNYDWLICDLNIYDCIPGIAVKDFARDPGKIGKIMYDLTATTQEHYILGYPYPLVEAHHLVSLTGDFKDEAIARVKHSLYASQQMDHTDIENLFLDLHSRF